MPKLLSNLKSRHRRAEGGQALVLFAAGLALFLGLVGLSIDVGMLVYTRTELQKQADGAALAGAQNLPNASEATSNATDYVAQNGGSEAQASVAISATYATNDTITVTTNKHVNYAFLKVLGLSGADVSAKAKVRANSYTGGAGIVPWGLIASNNSNSKLLQNQCFDKMVVDSSGNSVPTFKQGVECTLKYGAGTSSGGDFGALALDATGADIYREDIAKGSTKTFKVGDQVEAQTGNMIGPTGQALDDRMSRSSPACADALIMNSDKTASLRPGCEDDSRVIIIPVVDQINNPEKSTILGFAYMFLTDTGGSGGQTQIKGKFVKFVTKLPNGVYEGAPGDPDSTMVMLVE